MSLVCACVCVPYRRDECERVKRCGARVLTLDQLEGLKVGVCVCVCVCHSVYMCLAHNVHKLGVRRTDANTV